MRATLDAEEDEAIAETNLSDHLLSLSNWPYKQIGASCPRDRGPWKMNHLVYSAALLINSSSNDLLCVSVMWHIQCHWYFLLTDLAHLVKYIQAMWHWWCLATILPMQPLNNLLAAIPLRSWSRKMSSSNTLHCHVSSQMPCELCFHCCAECPSLCAGTAPMPECICSSQTYK